MDNLDTRVRRAIEEKVFPGCVIGILSGGKKQILPFGSIIYDTAENVTEHTVYDLASITKSIPLAILAAIFVHERKFGLVDKVRQFLPELQNDFDATIEDLLRYRVRGVQMATLHSKTFEEIRTHILERGFDGPPGASVYTNLPAFVLGMVIERVGGSSIAALADRYLFESLGMPATTFFPTKELCVPTEIVDGEVVQGIPHDESARVFARARRTVGHAGLFSAAPDLLQFAEHLISEPHGPMAIAAQEGLGWQVNDPNFMGVHAHPKMFGKTGFTGTSIMVDVEAGSALVILSNRTYPTRPADDAAIYAFRRDVADLVFRKQ